VAASISSLALVPTSSRKAPDQTDQILTRYVLFNLPHISYFLIHVFFQPAISSKELNVDVKEGKPMDIDAPPPPSKAIVPGGPGSQWRMMRLRRVYETAEEEGLSVEKVALDRFGSIQAFEEAREERRILDEREGRRADRGRGTDHKNKGRESDGEKRFMFTDIGASGTSSRSSSFRRPGGIGDSTPSTPSPPSGIPPPANRRLDSLRLPSQAASPLAQSHTPIPSVMTPPVAAASRSRGLSPSSLNRLQAKVLRAKLMGALDAEALEREYEVESRKAGGGGGGDSEGVRTRVEVLPTLDGQGRLYDVGHGKEDSPVLQGNRKKKEKVPVNVSIAFKLFAYRLLCSLKLAIPRLGNFFGIMRTTTLPLSGRCSGRSVSVLAWRTKKISILNLLVL